MGSITQVMDLAGPRKKLMIYYTCLDKIHECDRQADTGRRLVPCLHKYSVVKMK